MLPNQAREHIQPCSHCITREQSSPTTSQGSTVNGAPPQHSTREHSQSCSQCTQREHSSPTLAQGAQPTMLLAHPQHKGAQPTVVPVHSNGAQLPYPKATREHSQPCSQANSPGSTANRAPLHQHKGAKPTALPVHSKGAQPTVLQGNTVPLHQHKGAKPTALPVHSKGAQPTVLPNQHKGA